MTTYLKKQDLIDSGVYLLNARSAVVGIWNKDGSHFSVSCYSSGGAYLHVESHYDEVGGQGTAQPLKYLGVKLAHSDESLNKLHELSSQYEDELDKMLLELGLDEV